MTYGTPTGSPEAGEYLLVITDSTVESEELVAFSFTAPPYGGPGANFPDAEAMFQKIVTAVSADPDLVVYQAARIYPMLQPVTP
jgi:hypothetical protein